MTWDELLKSVSSGKLPKVRWQDKVGTVSTIKHKGAYKGCAVDIGVGWDVWFHAETQTDKRSKYMAELELIEDNIVIKKI